MTTRTVGTKYRGDPVSVIVAPDDDKVLHLRIGPVQQGKTRYAVLDRKQALRVAINLIRTANDLR